MQTTTHTPALVIFRRPPTDARRVSRDVAAALSVNHGEMCAISEPEVTTQYTDGRIPKKRLSLLADDDTDKSKF